jgi:excisionase family DNA binding protein
VNVTGVSTVAEKFYTPEEVLDRWKISRPSLQRLTDSGKLAFTRIGSQLRFTETALKDYETRNANVTALDPRKGKQKKKDAAACLAA